MLTHRPPRSSRLNPRWLALCVLLLSQLLAPVQAEALRVVVALPGPGAAPFLPIELMTRLGFDRQEGVQVTLRYFGGGPLAYKDLLAGNSDFAAAGFPALATTRDIQGRAYAFAALTQVPAYTLMVAQRLAPRVHDTRDLAGRTIGVHSAAKGGRSTGQQVVEYLLARAGLSVKQVNFVPAGQDYDAYASALASGAADALIANEPAATRLEEARVAYRLVDLHDPGVARQHMGNLFLYTQVCARAETLRNEPEKVKRFTTALRRTLQWIQLNSAQDIVAALAIKDPDERAIWTRILTRQKRMYSPDTQFSDDQIRAVETFLRTLEPANQHSYARLDSLIDDRWAGRKP